MAMPTIASTTTATSAATREDQQQRVPDQPPRDRLDLPPQRAEGELLGDAPRAHLDDDDALHDDAERAGREPQHDARDRGERDRAGQHRVVLLGARLQRVQARERRPRDREHRRRARPGRPGSARPARSRGARAGSGAGRRTSGRGSCRTTSGCSGMIPGRDAGVQAGYAVTVSPLRRRRAVGARRWSARSLSFHIDRMPHPPRARAPGARPGEARPCAQPVSTTLCESAWGRRVPSVPAREGRTRAMTSRILVVDDDTALAEMIGIVLRTEGFEHGLLRGRRAGRRRLALRAARPHPARPHAARHGRHRDLHAHPRRVRRPDHHADRAHRHRRCRQGPRVGRRRLHRQAVQPQRAGRPHPHPTAPREPAGERLAAHRRPDRRCRRPRGAPRRRARSP